MDVLVTILLGLAAMQQTGSKWNTKNVLGLLAVVCFFFDALWTGYLQWVVRTYVGVAEAESKIIRVKRVVVSMGALTLIVYLAFDYLRYASKWSMTQEGMITIAFLVAIFAVKIMRLLAINAFSKWVRLYWASLGAGLAGQGVQP